MSVKRFFSELAHYFFLIFWMKLIVQNTRKVTRFFGKTFGPNWLKRAKMAQNGPKITFGWKHAKMLDIMVRMCGIPFHMSGKTFVRPNFGQNCLKLSINLIAVFTFFLYET